MGPQSTNAALGRGSGWPRRLRRSLLVIVLGLGVVLPVFGCLLFAILPVPFTPLMGLRAVEGSATAHDWVPIERISPHLVSAVIAAEDARFCSHAGFDIDSIKSAWRRYLAAGSTRRLRGGSTITQQTVKNVFLWPERSWLRKGLEAWLTVIAETVWTKRRTIEIYLNVVEWGDGIYGAEAAARRHFNRSAADLSAAEAARLAAVLPSPRRWSASAPGPRVSERARRIQTQAASLGQRRACVS